MQEPIMFADDTNFFICQHIKTIYKEFNEELKKIGDWFMANKLS